VTRRLCTPAPPILQSMDKEGAKITVYYLLANARFHDSLDRDFMKSVFPYYARYRKHGHIELRSGVSYLSLKFRGTQEEKIRRGGLRPPRDVPRLGAPPFFIARSITNTSSH
jgi:hypothetical protein